MFLRLPISFDLQNHNDDTGAGDGKHVLAQPVLDRPDAAALENMPISRLCRRIGCDCRKVCYLWRLLVLGNKSYFYLNARFRRKDRPQLTIHLKSNNLRSRPFALCSRTACSGSARAAGACSTRTARRTPRCCPPTRTNS